jgi:creatinine amidohydrolase/Fe(II)-dependent formamide hydrolase-like protein
MSTEAAPAGGLEGLLVWDRLEVGPVALEPRRLRARYRVQLGERVEETELIYRYEQPVFEPGEPESENLAALIAAQVALNYGLFAREIVLRGPLDAHDRRWLREAAANTAREIYVIKILHPNPLLVGAARELRPELRRSYLQAELRFPDPAPTLSGAAWGSNAAGAPAAVLSSGGKESLLSLGLLEEQGLEVHPLFVNESGRHWFTALNGYRHLAATRPLTGRVWTNADRVFKWAARQLPLVRPDYDRMRADIYPVRLWTVAVFLFGVLPLLRRRGVARVAIGDEYDTTRRERFQGIPHYDGLYDQSRFFDEALTRFFERKGWGVQQFSLLRPLSELLVERTLAERYPKLLAAQVSCHAAHVEGERVLPCGRCEKCRRVVGMLTALGQQPAALGYSPEQVTECLADLAENGAHQLGEDAAHLGWLLARRGAIPPGSAFAVAAAPHPEVMRLRFDALRSPVNAIPEDLRPGVMRAALAHADGAVRRAGASWRAYDPLADQTRTPHPAGRPELADAGALPEGRDGCLLGELTWPQARRRLMEVDVALLPVGAVEQHGPHLPLDIDAWDAAYLALEVARACSEPRPLVLPLIPYGVSYHHDDFPGTLTVSPDTLAKMVHDVGLSAARTGVRKLVIINGHGGNIPALHFAAQLINRDTHIFTCVDTGESSDAEVAELLEVRADVHAGECETSTALATRPELVYLEHARPSIPDFQNRYLDYGSRVSVEWYVRTARISEDGTLGDPTRASAEKGERIWAVQIQNLVELVEHLKSTTLADLHRPGSGA